jgi:hypothetical protein
VSWSGDEPPRGVRIAAPLSSGTFVVAKVLATRQESTATSQSERGALDRRVRILACAEAEAEVEATPLHIGIDL